MTETQSKAPGPRIPAPDSQETTWFRPEPPRDRSAKPPASEREPDEAGVPVALPDSASVDAPPRSRARALGHGMLTAIRNWPVAVILAVFAVSAMVVPTMTDIATTDDWGYTRSVEILYYDGVLTVFPVVAATAVTQILWGALFALVFGMSLGVMRLSTVVMVALGAIALYAILRMLGVSKSRSALGMGVWLFNPLSFALSFSFMTDPHFSAMMLISLAFYVRGLRPSREHVIAILLGSLFAGFAFLMRQQGALIPFAVGMYLLFTGQVRFNRESIRRVSAVAVLPALMLIGYYAWLRWVNDVPAVQANFLADLQEDGWAGTWLIIQRAPVYVLFYAGLFLLPVLVAILPRRRASDNSTLFSSPVGFYACGAWTTVVLLGLYLAGRRNHEMPFASQFFGLGNVGPPDVLGSRQRLIERGTELPIALTIASAIGAILIGFVICRCLISEPSPERAGFWLIGVVGLWQLVGIFPPSYHYLNRGVTLDRYLLPVIALVIIAVLWALRDVRLLQPVSWVLLAAVAVYSTMATRDYLVYMDSIWSMARYANENGVENDRLDAGSGWDGYHLYTLMLEEDITRARSPQGSPWWVYFYAKPTDSSYIVATDPNVRRGYVTVESREYDQWLEDDPVSVYLLKLWHLPFPVENESTVDPRSDAADSAGDRQGRVTPTPVAAPAPLGSN
ncbi:MAG: glycosyltransferase family 39 protein [Chloroflexia bacterium]|nr:glycosyltransferase family 39 protein [Chloroflexia bacterium]